MDRAARRRARGKRKEAMIPLMLEEIIPAIEGRVLLPEGDSPNRCGRVTGVAIDSRAIRPGDLFFAIVGETHDGHSFVRGALANGAVAAIVNRGAPPPRDIDPHAVVIAVDDT